MIRDRSVLPNEYRIPSDRESSADIASRIEALVAGHCYDPGFTPTDYDPKDFDSYITGYSDEQTFHP